MTLFKQIATVALITLMSLESTTAPQAAQPDKNFNPANTVTLGDNPATSFRNFAPELAQTIARMPKIDPQTGLYVAEIEPGLFYVTEGVYQSAFLVTDTGITLFDAPPSFAYKLPGILAQYAPGKPIEYLIYSHGHNDHIGGSGVFADIPGLKIVASAEIARMIGENGRPGILRPTDTFEDSYKLTLGTQPVELKTAAFHSEQGDVIIYLPKLKFLIAVDTITPGEVPFMNFGGTSDMGGYLTMFDTLLAYDFDTIMSGHISILGNRNDLILARDYTYDVRDTALKSMADFYGRFESTLAKMDYQNPNLAYRAAMEMVRDDCADEIINRWSDRLSVVDVWADSHCETVVMYSIMH